jgi:hypothetical protein
MLSNLPVYSYSREGFYRATVLCQFVVLFFVASCVVVSQRALCCIL